MSTDWKNWCRLCGCKDNSDIDVFIKDENFFSLSEAIQRYFSITICDGDEASKKICAKCQTLISEIVTFSMKATKVQEMYSELLFNDSFEMLTNYEQIRIKYEISGESDNNFEDHSSSDKQSGDEKDDQEQPTNRKRRKRNISEENDPSYCEKDDLINETDSNDTEINDFDEILTHVFDSVNEEINVYVEIKEEELEEISDIQKPEIKTNSPSNQEINVNFEIKEEELEEISDIKKPRKKPEIKTKSPSKDYNIFCEVCNKGFANQGGYKWHLRKVHKIVKERETYPCKTCGKVFHKREHLQIHENVHLPPDQRKSYSCPHCDKKFTAESSVGNHIRTVHIKEKCFICDVCGKSYVTKDSLNSHKSVHTDECPFQCPKCPKCFKRLPLLKKHLDSHDDTKYICPICELQLNTKTTLRRHMVIHSDEKKYKCNFCEKEFKRSKALKNHLIIHTGLKPYECPFCGQTFANGSNCRKHQKNSHPKELATMEDVGEKKTNNVPSMELLKAVNDEAILIIQNSRLK